MTRSRSRSCHTCGDSYYRRNIFEAWTSRNPGHHKGWAKEVKKTCLTCTTAKTVNHVFMVVDVQAAKAPRRRKKRAA